MSVWVMFTGKTDLSWLKILKPGFRHCYVLMNDGERWISVDPLSPHTEIIVHNHVSSEFDLVQWLEKRGEKAIQANINWNKKQPAPFMIFTCVEAVKRILGLHVRRIITPFQLYTYLNQNNKGEPKWV